MKQKTINTGMEEMCMQCWRRREESTLKVPVRQVRRRTVRGHNLRRAAALVAALAFTAASLVRIEHPTMISNGDVQRADAFAIIDYIANVK